MLTTSYDVTQSHVQMKQMLTIWAMIYYIKTELPNPWQITRLTILPLQIQPILNGVSWISMSPM